MHLYGRRKHLNLAMDLVAHAIFEILMTPQNFYFLVLDLTRDTLKKSEIVCLKIYSVMLCYT